jgi:hypothetical protein
VQSTNPNLINRKKRGKARDNAEDEAVAQEEALLRNREALNREVLAQDIHEQETLEEALLSRWGK